MNYKDTIGYIRDNHRVIPIQVGNIGNKFDSKKGLLLYMEIGDKLQKKVFGNEFNNYFKNYTECYFEFKNRDVINILEKIAKNKNIYLFKNWKKKIEEIFIEEL